MRQGVRPVEAVRVGVRAFAAQGSDVVEASRFLGRQTVL
jgi:hypothetical protein